MVLSLDKFKKIMPIIATLVIALITFIGGGIVTKNVEKNPRVQNIIKAVLNSPTDTPTPTKPPTKLTNEVKECKLLGCGNSVRCPNEQGKYEGSCTWATTICVTTTDCEKKSNLKNSHTTDTSSENTSANLPTPTQVPTQNYEAICNSEKEQWVAEFKSKWNQIILEINTKLSQLNDPLLYNAMTAKASEYKIKVNDCINTCSPQYFQYCLNHQGNIDGFNMNSECSVCNLN